MKYRKLVKTSFGRLISSVENETDEFTRQGNDKRELLYPLGSNTVTPHCLLRSASFVIAAQLLDTLLFLPIIHSKSDELS